MQQLKNSVKHILSHLPTHLPTTAYFLFHSHPCLERKELKNECSPSPRNAVIQLHLTSLRLSLRSEIRQRGDLKK